MSADIPMCVRSPSDVHRRYVRKVSGYLSGLPIETVFQELVNTDMPKEMAVRLVEDRQAIPCPLFNCGKCACSNNGSQLDIDCPIGWGFTPQNGASNEAVAIHDFFLSIIE